MSWKDILKTDAEYPPLEEMIRKLWKDWLYNELEGYGIQTFEMYSDGSDAYWAKQFDKITNPLYKLDPINDVNKIKKIMRELENFATLPMETIDYPIIGLNHAEEDIQPLYDRIGD
tara:strand:- start:16776 stop:17123 length:348 start_codon:yes stop_codon:yes gene_type:complete